MKNIVIFASGTGTNAENIARHFAGSDTVKVAALFTSNRRAGAIERMAPYGVPCYFFSREQWNNPTEIIDELRRLDTHLIVLAGFLSMVGKPIIDAVGGNIINIHPSLLPRHGGKGMWGMNVHRAVLEAGERHNHSLCDRSGRRRHNNMPTPLPGAARRHARVARYPSAPARVRGTACRHRAARRTTVTGLPFTTTDESSRTPTATAPMLPSRTASPPTVAASPPLPAIADRQSLKVTFHRCNDWSVNGITPKANDKSNTRHIMTFFIITQLFFPINPANA